MNFEKMQIDLQQHAICKLMSIHSQERSFPLGKAIFLIGIVAGAAIKAVGMAYFVVIPYSLFVCYCVKILIDEAIDRNRWRPICEAILDAKYDYVVVRLDAFPKEGISLTYTNINGELSLVDKKVIFTYAYALKELLSSKSGNSPDSFSEIKERAIKRLEVDVWPPLRQNIVGAVQNMNEFSKTTPTPVASKIHFVLFRVLHYLDDYSGLDQDRLRSGVKSFCDRARTYFCNKSTPLTDFELELFKNIENSPTLSGMKDVNGKVTHAQKTAIISTAYKAIVDFFRN